MKNQRVALALMTALSAAGLAVAHEGRSHMKGTVETTTEHTLVIHSLEGKSVSVRLTDETGYRTADGTSADRSRLRPGLRVVVEGVEDDDGIRAETILLPRPPEGSPPADAPHTDAKKGAL